MIRRKPRSTERPRRFLFVQSTTEQGGAETVLLNALAAGPELREQSMVATLGFGSGDLVQRLELHGVEVVRLERARIRSPLGVLRNVRALARLARARGVEVLVGNGAHPQVFAGWASRLAGARTAYFVHMIHSELLLANNAIDVLAVRGPMDLALANSKSSLAVMRSLRPRVRQELLYPGTTIEEVGQEEAAGARRELGAGAEAILFGIFGRLQYWKGQDVFLAAAEHAAGALPGARFAVVGGSVFGLEPEYKEALRALAARPALRGKVVFTDDRRDVARLMAACDVVCHATRGAEPFGMVIIEAMAQGRPVICARAGGPAEIVSDGESGMLFDPGRPGDLAEAMVRLGRDAEARRRLGEAARLRVAKDFNAVGFANRLSRLLGDLADE